MAAPELTPEQEALIQQLSSRPRYEHGNAKTKVLADEINMDEGDFKKLILAMGWRRQKKLSGNSPRAQRLAMIEWASRVPSPPPPAPDPPATAPEDTPPANVATLVERQLSAIDRILADLHGAHGAPPERSARTIASVSRTLKELMRMRAQAPSAPDHDSDMPRDIDEFRRDLARRIDAFVASGEDGAVADAGGATEA